MLKLMFYHLKGNRRNYKLRITMSITDMAKVRPSNLFLRPLDLFRYLEKQTIQVHLNKIKKLYLILLNKHKKDLKISAAPVEKWYSKLAREQKSLASPGL